MGTASDPLLQCSSTKTSRFEMNATLFQVGNPGSDGGVAPADVRLVREPCKCIREELRHLSDANSFVEENHAYKAASQARQSRQPSKPGRPSQDMMSYWGIFAHRRTCVHD
jgi:hypothetical protein